eukprot:Pgem_evm1s264
MPQDDKILKSVIKKENGVTKSDDADVEKKKKLEMKNSNVADVANSKPSTPTSSSTTTTTTPGPKTPASSIHIPTTAGATTTTTDENVENEVKEKEKAKPINNFNYVVMRLENTILPDKQLLETPTQRDGIDSEAEIQLRLTGCELIQVCGRLLKLPQVAVASAQILFQRFYYKKSFVFNDYRDYALGCLLLAAKTEECVRRARQILNVFNYVKHRKIQEERVKEGLEEEEPVYDGIYSDSYIIAKNNIIKAER